MALRVILGIALLSGAGGVGFGASHALAAPEAEAEADPLFVPRGRGPAPEDNASMPLVQRLKQVSDAQRERGFEESPVLAWALLSRPDMTADASQIEAALALAPSSPSVRFEAGRLLRSPSEIVQAIASVKNNLPALLWIATVLGAALGAAVLFSTLLICALTFARSLTLHGHALGHALLGKEPPSWPGGLLIVAALALAAVFGVGPVLLMALAGVIAATRLPAKGATVLAISLSVCGVALGPGVDYWSRVATVSQVDPGLAAIWRADRGGVLPGDRERLERIVAARPDDLAARIGIALLAGREGDLPAARAVLADFQGQGALSLFAQADNLRGILHLADGHIGKALNSFQDAGSAGESAAVLFNLSQAYARGVRLLERSGPFESARILDPELINRYARNVGTNIHEFLIWDQIGLDAYAQRVLAPSAVATRYAQGLRSGLLGPRVPDMGWLLLPLFGLLGIALRRTGIHRCTRCDRALCAVCVPNSRGRSCQRCSRLFARGSRADPRVRAQQLKIESRRSQQRALFRSGLALIVPGAGRALSGRLSGALFSAGVTVLALALLAGDQPTVPFELGALGQSAVLWLGRLSAVLAISLVLLDVRVQLRTIRRDA